MASLKDIRDAFKTTLETAIPSLHVYDTVPDSAGILPAVVIMPASSDFAVAFQRGTDTHEFDLLVLASYNDPDIAQDQLDELVSGAGVNSIRQAIYQNRSLNLPGVDAHISTMFNYGSTFAEAGIAHIGATLHAIVHTRGYE